MPDLAEKPRRNKWLRVIDWVSLILVLGPPVLDFASTRLAQYRLDKTLAALHAVGEPLTAADLKRDSIPDSQNASLDYKSAADSIDPNSVAWKKYTGACSNEFQLPFTDAERKTVRTIVLENTTALAKVIAAGPKIAGNWNDSLDQFALGAKYDQDLMPAASLCSLLRLAAVDAHVAGNDLLAVQRLSDSLTVADAAERRPTLVAHLVALGASNAAGNLVSTLVPEFYVGSHGLARQQLIDLMHQFQNEEPINTGDKLSWRSERIIDLHFWDTLNLRRFIKPILLNDQSCMCDYLQGIMIASEAPDWPTAQRKMPTDLLSSVAAHPYYHLFLSLMISSSNKTAMLGYIAKSNRRLAAASLAVRLYAADHNQQLPASLSDLVPAYLPEIPIDPLSGQPMKYKDNPPRIYSVGEDCVDDGGIPIDPDSPDKFHRHHGDTVVYLTTQSRKKINQP